jgi:ABC-2 type transport system ATP-binding protein
VLREAILDLRKNNTTVIFSTHDMSVAEKMCDFIFMIHRGRKVLDGTLEKIQDAHGSNALRVRLDGSPDLRGLPGASEIIDFGKYQEIQLAPDADSQRILVELSRRGTVRLFELARPSLHEIFVRIARPEPEEDNHHA